MLGLLALWLIATAGLRPLMLPDEGRYAGVAYAMLQSGDLMLPRLHGLPYFHKPPLMYWIDAAAMQAFGANVWSARAASMIGAWVMGAALWLGLRRRVGDDRAAMALLVLATTPAFFLGGQYANLDMLVAGWITLAIICGARASEALAPLRWAIGAWAAAALAVLSKGLIGLVLPALVLLPWLIAQRRWRGLQRLLHPAGWLLFLLLVLPWFIAMQQRFPGFFDYFVIEQHLRRYTQATFNNPQPFWFFFIALPLATLPWSAALPAAVRRWRGALADADVQLALWWIAAVLLFFSLPRSKLIGYMFPALAPWCALLALAFTRARWWRATALLAAITCVTFAAVLAWQAPASNRDLGLALRDHLQTGERVVFIDEPFFDVPFYARMTEPPIVLADWDDPMIATRDNWRKELHDAARFDPARAAQRLWPLARTDELRCAPGTVWWLAKTPPPWLADATTVLHGRHGWLLRSDGGAGRGCR
jgi:4-amino-4-deoxy-L-arabinose transferase-like glycosyltransferase